MVKNSEYVGTELFNDCNPTVGIGNPSGSKIYMSQLMIAMIATTQWLVKSKWLWQASIIWLRGYLQKKKSLFKDIIQIKFDHPPSYPIFDKLFFDKF